jgi:hypothetical protein
MGLKNDSGIKLVQAEGVKNIFVNDWKKNFFEDDKKKIASIAFLRNLVEFTRGEADPTYIKLTSMLHWRPDTAGLTVAGLDVIYNTECHTDRKSSGPQRALL